MAAGWLIDLFEGATHHALSRWLSSPVRSLFAAAFFIAAHVGRHRFPAWFMEVAFGQWISLALQMSVGMLGAWLFRLPLLDTHRRGAAWAWSSVGLALGIAAVTVIELKAHELVLWPIIAVVSWFASQVAFVTRWRGSANDYTGVVLMRSLYGFLFFVFIAPIVAALGGRDDSEYGFLLLHGAAFSLLMVPIHMRAEARLRK